MRKGWVKGLCALLFVVFLLVGIAATALSVNWYYEVDSAKLSFYDTSLCWSQFQKDKNLLYSVSQAWAKTVLEDSAASGKVAEMLEKLDEGNTNFRVAAYTEEGDFLFGHEEMEHQVYEVYHTENWRVEYYSQSEQKVKAVEFDLYYGVLNPLQVEDGYSQAKVIYDLMNENWPVMLGVGIACLLLAIVLFVMLIRGAGRHVGTEEVTLNWQDKIPFDLYLVISGVLICLAVAGLTESSIYLDEGLPIFLAFCLCAVAAVALALALILTATTRIKARTLFKNTLIWRVCKLIWRGVTAVSAALPLIGKAALVSGGYLLVSMMLMIRVCYHRAGFLVVLWTLLTLVVIAYLLWWAYQWKRVRIGASKIIAGETDYAIDTSHMSPDMKQHAGELNNLGQAISAAVDERMKSERFRAELITNVSHDLKTPLTSIINYVDLLKKEDIPNPTAQEYIEVLDRKSQRLKKLTEDLVEASKASTGSLSVEREKLDAGQLIRQAVGEYEEKLTDAGLSPVVTVPDKPVYIMADGRHVWRIMDNLLGNCVKYALGGTRVYVELEVRAGEAVMTVKNISSQPLNIPAYQLMDRFVRGDESRSTEGSGLGLSIAASLTQLQKGTFDLRIDGDLFKATVKLPLAKEN